MSTQQPFTDLTDAYEAMIDWPKRLANEEPFYRWLFERFRARSVLDAACGTGHHAVVFHSWGLRVEGADLSDAMIRRCRQRAPESDTLRWAVRGFDQPTGSPAAFDVAICVGNSLALAPDQQTAANAIRELLASVRPGGALVLHILNLWRLPDGPCLWQKCQRARLPQGESLIIKGIHRAGPCGYVDLLVTSLESAPPAMQSECVPFLGLEADQLAETCRASGAAGVDIVGSYARQPYDRATSQDLILVATK